MKKIWQETIAIWHIWSDPFISYVLVDRLDKTYELSDEPTPAKCHVAEAPRHFSGKQHHERNPKTEG